MVTRAPRVRSPTRIQADLDQASLGNLTSPDEVPDLWYLIVPLLPSMGDEFKGGCGRLFGGSGASVGDRLGSVGVPTVSL